PRRATSPRNRLRRPQRQLRIQTRNNTGNRSQEQSGAILWPLTIARLPLTCCSKTDSLPARRQSWFSDRARAPQQFHPEEPALVDVASAGSFQTILPVSRCARYFLQIRYRPRSATSLRESRDKRYLRCALACA